MSGVVVAVGEYAGRHRGERLTPAAVVQGIIDERPAEHRTVTVRAVAHVLPRVGRRVASDRNGKNKVYEL